MIEDEQPPAPVVAADRRPCQMHGATGIPAGGPVTEERAGPGKLIDNTRIQKKVTLVGINTDRGFLTGVIIMYQKTKVPGILFYRLVPRGRINPK